SNAPTGLGDARALGLRARTAPHSFYRRPSPERRTIMWFPFKVSTRRPKPRSTFSRLTVEALEGRTVPSFLPVVSTPVGSARTNQTVGDFNNDAIPDLIATDNASQSVNVMLGNGNGTFQTARSSTTGANVYEFGIGDFNRDGKLDIATAN